MASASGASPSDGDGIGSTGCSKNWTARKNDVLRLLDDFVLQADFLACKTWAELEAEDLIKPEFYQRFSEWLTARIIPPGCKNSGDHYAEGSVLVAGPAPWPPLRLLAEMTARAMAASAAKSLPPARSA